MARTTSIVNYPHFLRLYLTSISIGMVSFKKQPTGSMELLLLANARLRPRSLSFMSSMSSNLVLTGITRIYVSLHYLISKILPIIGTKRPSIVTGCVVPWLFMTPTILIQRCMTLTTVSSSSSSSLPFCKHTCCSFIESTVITLADWYHLPSPAATPTLTRPFPYSNATLINGKGRYEGGPAAPLSVVNIETGKRYRFRIVSMACDPNFTFSIDNHQFTVIEADGEGVVPLLVDSLVISPGQRYSVVLNANQPVDNYWIRAEPSRGIPGFAGGINSAILRYSGAPVSEPLTVQHPSIMPLLETALVPSTSPAAPGIPAQGQADVVINIAHDFDFDSFHYRMNGYPWIPPKVPVLLQILSGARTAQELLPKGSVYSLPRNKVIELSLPGTGPELGGPVRCSFFSSYLF